MWKVAKVDLDLRLKVPTPSGGFQEVSYECKKYETFELDSDATGDPAVPENLASKKPPDASKHSEGDKADDSDAAAAEKRAKRRAEERERRCEVLRGWQVENIYSTASDADMPTGPYSAMVSYYNGREYRVPWQALIVRHGVATLKEGILHKNGDEVTIDDWWIAPDVLPPTTTSRPGR